MAKLCDAGTLRHFGGGAMSVGINGENNRGSNDFYQAKVRNGDENSPDGTLGEVKPPVLMGLALRDKRRFELLGGIAKPEVRYIEHNPIVIAVGLSPTQHIRNAFLNLVSSHDRSPPPQIAYQLLSSGVSYRDNQRANPIYALRDNTIGRLVVVFPESLKRRVIEVVVVDRTTRLVFDSARITPEANWRFNEQLAALSANSLIVWLTDDRTQGCISLARARNWRS